MTGTDGCILRIATEQWVNQVFDIATYYTSLRRKWKPGQTILFVHKTDAGDSIIGYGIVENAYEKDDVSETERHQCEEHGWKRAIEFRYVFKLEKPLLIKETLFRDSKLRGRFLHGLRLNKEQLKEIMAQIEQSQR